MERMRLGVLLVLWGVFAAQAMGADEPATNPATKPDEKEDKATQYQRQLAEKKDAAEACYKKLAEAYMSNQWDQVKELLAESRAHIRYMERDKQSLVSYMRTSVAEFRPRWWEKTKSPSNVSFGAQIWKRGFVANYMPSEMLGMQAPVGIQNGRIQVIVSWRPTMVDNPAAAEGELAKLHKMTKGDIGEVIVWHELGHNYITSFLPLRQVIALYRDHEILFHHLQEFYADMTSLYHCSPRARKAVLMLRLDLIEGGRETSAHARMAYGIGSWLLSEWLENPEAWPSVHLPPKVPEQDAERNTIVYVYENLSPSWTVEEDKALRDMIWKFIRLKGEAVLRGRGTVPLANKLEFKLVESEDREQKAQRDKWVAEKLTAAIEAGRADKPDGEAEKDEDGEIIFKKGDVTIKRSIGGRGKRIVVPW